MLEVKTVKMAARSRSNNKVVFVTVGTTSFDELIKVVSSRETRKVLESLGFSHLVIQIGRGTYEPESTVETNFRMDVYRFKDNITEDIQRASLVISHAGAGSVLEVMDANKPLIVVINELLMGNHQTELAFKLYKDGHLIYCTPSKLVKTVKEMDIGQLKPYPPGDPSLFGRFLDKAMGLV